MVGTYQNLRHRPQNLRHRHLTGLGDSVLCPAPVKSQLDSLASQLAQANADLVDLQNQIAAANQAGADMRDAGTGLVSQRADLEAMVSALTTGYRTFCGTVPPGLSGTRSFHGLGIIPAIPLTTAAVLIAGLVAAIAVWWEYEQTLKDKIAAQVQDHISTAQQNLQDAIDSGDPNAQQIWTAQLNNLNNQATGAGSWLANNWQWVAVGVGAFAFVLILRD